MEGNWQESWKACESGLAQANPYWNPYVDIYVGMRAVCQGAFRPKIRGFWIWDEATDIRQKHQKLYDRNLKGFKYHSSHPPLYVQSPMSQLTFPLSTCKVFNSINGAAASGYGAGGNLLFRFGTPCTSNSPKFSILLSIVWFRLHDEWKGCVFHECLLHDWDWILRLGS